MGIDVSIESFPAIYVRKWIITFLKHKADFVNVSIAD